MPSVEITSNLFALNVPISTISGNLGIGTTTPEHPLHVQGTVRATQFIGDGSLLTNLPSGGGSPNLSGTLNVSGDIIPTQCNVYDLGSANYRWKDLYLSGNTIDLQGLLLSKSSDSNQLIVKDQSNNLAKIVANEIQIGDTANGSNVVVLRQDTNTGQIQIQNVDSQGNTSNFSIGAWTEGTTAGVSTDIETLLLMSDMDISHQLTYMDGSCNMYIACSSLSYELSNVPQKNFDGTNSQFVLNNVQSALPTPFLLKYDALGNAKGCLSWNNTTSTYAAGTPSHAFTAITSDCNNNVYTSGSLLESTSNIIRNFDGTNSSKYIHASSSSAIRNPLMIKIDADGNVQGVVDFNGAALTASSYTIATNILNDGTTYVSGYYTKTTGTVPLRNMDDTESVYTLNQTNANGSPFVIKYTSSGIIQGTFSFPYNNTNGTCTLEKTDIDTQGNLYIVGGYGKSTSGTMALSNLDGTVSSMTLPGSTTGTTLYVIKINTSGVIVGAFGLPNVVFDTNTYPLRIKTDTLNNVYVCGHRFSTTPATTITNLDGTPATLSKSFGTNTPGIYGFVIKWDANGNLSAAFALTHASYLSRVHNIVTDSQNNVIFATMLVLPFPYPLDINYQVPSFASAGTDITLSVKPLTSNITFLIKYSNSGVLLGVSYIQIATSGTLLIYVDNNDYVYCCIFPNLPCQPSQFSISYPVTVQSSKRLRVNTTNIIVWDSTGNVANIYYVYGGVNYLNISGNKVYTFNTNIVGYFSNLKNTTQISRFIPTTRGVVIYNLSGFSTTPNVPNISTTKYVGIGTDSPQSILDIYGDGARQLTASSWNVGSDERLKTDIQLADYEMCYQNMKALELKYFRWKDEIPIFSTVADRHKLGWIAQDVQEIFPKAVTTMEQSYGLSNVLNLNVDQIYAMMYGTIKQLISVVENQQNEINELKQKVI